MPKITTELRKDIVKVPKVIRQASGIQIFGKQIRSIILLQILQSSAIPMQMR